MQTSWLASYVAPWLSPPITSREYFSGWRYGGGRILVQTLAAGSYSQTFDCLSFTPRRHWYPWPSDQPGNATKRPLASSNVFEPSTQQTPGGEVFGKRCLQTPFSSAHVKR